MPEGEESKFYGVGLFNWVESDLSYLNYKSASLHLGYLLRRNVRLVSEFIYNFTGEFGQFGIGFFKDIRNHHFPEIYHFTVRIGHLYSDRRFSGNGRHDTAARRDLFRRQRIAC